MGRRGRMSSLLFCPECCCPDCTFCAAGSRPREVTADLSAFVAFNGSPCNWAGVYVLSLACNPTAQVFQLPCHLSPSTNIEASCAWYYDGLFPAACGAANGMTNPGRLNFTLWSILWNDNQQKQFTALHLLMTIYGQKWQETSLPCLYPPPGGAVSCDGAQMIWTTTVAADYGQYRCVATGTAQNPAQTCAAWGTVPLKFMDQGNPLPNTTATNCCGVETYYGFDPGCGVCGSILNWDRPVTVSAG